MAISNNVTAQARLDLGVAMREFLESQDEYIGTRVFPVTNVPDETGYFYALERESMVRRLVDGNALALAPKAEAPERDTTLRQVLYACQEYGERELIPDTLRKRYESGFDADRAVTQQLTRDLMTAHELRVAALLFNTTTFTGSALFTDVAAAWATTTTDVRKDVEDAAQVVRNNCGADISQLTLIVNYAVHNALMRNDDFVNEFAPTAFPTRAARAQALAQWLGVRDVQVGRAVQNTARQGQTFVGGSVWSSTYAMLALVGNSADLTEPAIGRTMLWTASTASPVVVESYREEPKRSDVIQVRQNTDELLIDPAFGHLLKID